MVLAQNMIERTLDEEMPFSQLTADKADGQMKSLRIWLEEREVSYVPATSLGHDVFTPDGRNGRAKR